MSFDGDLAQARSNGDENDGRADVQCSALLDAPMLLLDYLIAGPPPSEMDEPMTDADGVLLELPKRLEMDSQEDDTRANVSPFERLVAKSLTEEGKQVAVLCHSGANVRAEHPTFAASIIEEISRRFKAGKINVVEAEKVVAWTKDHAGHTADSDLTALATDLGADYIVHFQIESLGFAEENYPELHRGRAQGLVVVAETAVDEKGQKRTRVVFRQPFESKYPNSASIVADPEEPDSFKQRYLARLYHELARLFLSEP
jgi:hypothetical protein